MKLVSANRGAFFERTERRSAAVGMPHCEVWLAPSEKGIGSLEQGPRSRACQEVVSYQIRSGRHKLSEIRTSDLRASDPLPKKGADPKQPTEAAHRPLIACPYICKLVRRVSTREAGHEEQSARKVAAFIRPQSTPVTGGLEGHAEHPSKASRSNISA